MTFVIDPGLTSNGAMLVNRITTNGETLQVETLKEVRVSNVEGQHEIAAISCSLTTPQVNALQDQTIHFTYGPRLKLGNFYGYIAEITPSRNYQSNMMYDLMCIGATAPMQVGHPRFYVNKSVTDVVADIVGKHHLGVQVERSAFHFPTLAQTAETDWTFVVQMAHLAGFGLYSHQGVVRMVNPLRVLNESGPILRLVKGDEVLDKSRLLLDFQPTAYSATKPAYVKPSYGFFNNGKPQVTHVPDNTHNFDSSTPVLDKTMADFFLNAWNSTTDVWLQTAEARIQGSTAACPGMVVSIQISGSSVVQHDYDGLWLIKSVTHQVTAGSFQTQLSLVRDTKKRLANINFKPWTQAGQGYPRLYQDTPSSNWKSTWKAPHYLSSIVTKAKTPANPVWKTS